MSTHRLSSIRKARDARSPHSRYPLPRGEGSDRREMIGQAFREYAIAAGTVAPAICADSACADGPRLGKPLSGPDLVAWDISVMPDGAGLPPGSGTAAQGAAIYVQKCITCHGEGGKGGISAAL